ncbi:MAG: MFS transporter [Gammaproteobacteria bacterium]|nr:POT family MFS transporter [Gammaproteobacteria bacterium]PCH62487.1 MAG: MFS transporter [Gammaproteobacteria bacterium]
MSKYRNAPFPSNTLPSGIPYIIGNEAAERFSFYGMRAILVVFMTQYLLGENGELAVMSEDDAKGWYHYFLSAVYFTPLLGAILADGILGKFRTIILLSIVYVIGHFVLALDETHWGLAVGLGLIALGAGGIKPCVTSHVGDQFGHSNQHLLSTTYGWFYFAINLGAFISFLLTPWLLKHYGASVAFSVPGILMLIATIVFWAGRNKFAHIPPQGRGFIKDVFSKTGLATIGKLAVVYAFVAVFWALFDQTGSSWVLQSQQMDRMVFGYELLPSQIQSANPLLIMILIPLFAFFIYPAINKIFPLTAMRKIGIGLALTALSFIIITWIQSQIDSGQTPHISWQLLAYIIITAGEVMVSITCLEFSYTQAPRSMKSFVMALFFMSAAIGNLFTGTVNFFIQNPDGTSKLEGADYFIFFTLIMLVTTLLFTLYARFYKEKTYIQHEMINNEKLT